MEILKITIFFIFGVWVGWFACALINFNSIYDAGRHAMDREKELERLLSCLSRHKKI